MFLKTESLAHHLCPKLIRCCFDAENSLMVPGHLVLADMVFFLLSFGIGFNKQNNLLEKKYWPLIFCIPKLSEWLFTLSHAEIVGSAL